MLHNSAQLLPVVNVKKCMVSQLHWMQWKSGSALLGWTN